ncbi:HK97-gp10 family putative phage morphogenesis protein [Shewanella baltica]|uniref:HK97-gp10 family putative phage morphogenesis protein n=1 Tax=Shewanella baltica TaxID=62322 RepID=UPI003D7B7D62
MDIKWDVQGLQELERQLLELGAQTGQKVLRRAGRIAMEPVKADMVAGAGFDNTSKEQHMRDSIRISTHKGSGKVAEDNAAIIRVGPSKKESFKALWQEYGNNKVRHSAKGTKRGRKQPRQTRIVGRQEADPFMRVALAQNREIVVETFKSELAIAIQKAIKKGG